MPYSAFQSNCFQLNAFQILGSGTAPPAPTRDTHDGAIKRHKIHLPIYGKTNATPGNIQLVYDKARALPRKQTKELRDAVSNFVDPKIAMQAAVPVLEEIDYAALKANQQAYEKFLVALNNIQQNLVIIDNKQNEDDELFLLAVLCCEIN